MAKLAKLDAIGTKLDLEHFQVGNGDKAERESSLTLGAPMWIKSASAVIILVALVVAGIEITYANRTFPGVTADGVNVGGLSTADATARLSQRVREYDQASITVTYDGTSHAYPISSLGVTYDVVSAVKQAEAVGREGSPWSRVRQQLHALTGGTTSVSSYSYNGNNLGMAISGLDDQIVTPVADATLTFSGSQAQVNADQAGTRLDMGKLTSMVLANLNAMSTAPVAAPVYQLQAGLASGTLAGALGQIDSAVAAPINISYNGTTRQIDQNTIVSWMDVNQSQAQPFLSTLNLANLFPVSPTVNLGLDPSKVKAYVASLAAGIDQPGQNATLAWQNNAVTVVHPSQDGLALDQQDTYNQIMASLAKPAGERNVTLKVADAPAAVNENNIASLGITQQLSEGKTNFYWSPASRITNIELGTARFNDVLLSPGETFSFGKILGPATPAQGYVPGWVILGNSEQQADGGGLCQVTTTAFRAALLAGLPITQRTSHAFAISYYTWPYGVPGVDATIYYPELDLKFLNDTGHYILIQTAVDTNANTVTFDLYGTKTKVGVIRGPYFVEPNGTQTSDPNYATAAQASHTVFYRDVEDLNGNVIRTDTFNTYYKPSTDFPPESD